MFSPTPTRDAVRTISLLDRVGLSTPSKVDTLRRPTAAESTCSLPGDDTKARALLAQQRKQTAGYKPAEKRIRYKFSAGRRAKASDETTWTFTTHEVALLLDNLLSEPCLGPAGVAEAVLRQADTAPLHDVWAARERQGKLQKAVNLLRTLKISKSGAPALLDDLPWLNTVAQRQAADYVGMICQFDVSQTALDKALGVALSHNSLAVVKLLLSYGADANKHINLIKPHLRRDDVALAKLLLAAPTSVSTEVWRVCLDPHRNINTTVLSICLANRLDIPSQDLLRKAIKLQLLPYSTVLLAHLPPASIARLDRELVCREASEIADHDSRLQFLTLLREAGCIIDCGALQKTLYDAVKRRQPVASVLIDAGITVDKHPYNTLAWIVDTDPGLLESLQDAKLSSGESVATALRSLPISLSESKLLRALEALARMSARGSHVPLPGEDLGRRLVHAARHDQPAVVRKLLAIGADPSFNDGAAIQAAVSTVSHEILEMLLLDTVPQVTLSKVVPIATAVSSKVDRLHMFENLLTQSILPEALGIALESIISEHDEANYGLIKLLICKKAPPDCSDWYRKNSVIVASCHGDLQVLKLLCAAKPRTETLSRAVGFTYEQVRTIGYRRTIAVLSLLLTAGARGDPVDLTLWMAAQEINCLDVVRLLIANGADVNQRDGALFADALKRESPDLLRELCKSECKPAPRTLEKTIDIAIDRRFYNASSFDLLMKSATIGSSGSVATSVWISARVAQKLENHPSASKIIMSFLRAGLYVDTANGEALCLAVRCADPLVLNELLSRSPCRASLAAAFEATLAIERLPLKLKLWKSLLTHASSAEIGQSRMLLQQTTLALAGNRKGMLLLLKHGASVDFDNGSALTLAASAGSLEELEYLLASKPTPDSLSRACLAAASSHRLSEALKSQICKALVTWNKGLPEAHRRKLLYDSVRKMPKDTLLPALLLDEDLQVGPDTLNKAVIVADRNLLTLLFEHSNQPETVFECAQKLPRSHANKLWIYQRCLEDSDHNITTASLSNALLDTIKVVGLKDMGTVKLLLKHGADVGWEDGMLFKTAVAVGSRDAFRLFCQHIRTTRVGDVALGILASAHSARTEIRRSMFGHLLARAVSRSACSAAFKTLLDSNVWDLEIARLLLAKGAKANRQSLIIASQKDDVSLFRELCRHLTDGDVAVRVILDHHVTEAKAVSWFQACMDEMPAGLRLTDGKLLVDCLKKFPSSETLLRRLVGCGIPYPNAITHTICQETGPEDCSLLVWALLAEPRIPTKTIMLLLKAKYDAVELGYVTPKTHVSAAFASLLDADRLLILKTLLAIDRGRVTDYEVPERTLAQLSRHEHEGDEDADSVGPQGLCMAAFYLGNFDAFRLLDDGYSSRDEGLLHTAAFLALPKFVERLLCTHDPNLRLEEYEYLIPLMIAIDATTPSSWGKVANDEDDYATRRKKTIQLLARKTDMSIQGHHRRTALHYALHQGVETTTILLDALDLRSDPRRWEIFSITDKDGKKYKPHEYVNELDISAEEKRELCHCLKKANMGPGWGLFPGAFG